MSGLENVAIPAICTLVLFLNSSELGSPNRRSNGRPNVRTPNMDREPTKMTRRPAGRSRTPKPATVRWQAGRRLTRAEDLGPPGYRAGGRRPAPDLAGVAPVRL